MHKSIYKDIAQIIKHNIRNPTCKIRINKKHHTYQKPVQKDLKYKVYHKMPLLGPLNPSQQFTSVKAPTRRYQHVYDTVKPEPARRPKTQDGKLVKR
jgi:hypothetical protein